MGRLSDVGPSTEHRLGWMHAASGGSVHVRFMLILATGSV